MGVVEFKYPSVSESEERMLDELQALLARNEIPARESRAFMQSVSEAFINALVHGNRLDPEKVIMIRLNINKQKLTADIVDQGRGGLDSIRQRNPAGPLAESGRGIDLMRNFATSVEFSETEKGGLKVSIRLDRKWETELNRYK